MNEKLSECIKKRFHQYHPVIDIDDQIILKLFEFTKILLSRKKKSLTKSNLNLKGIMKLDFFDTCMKFKQDHYNSLGEGLSNMLPLVIGIKITFNLLVSY